MQELHDGSAIVVCHPCKGNCMPGDPAPHADCPENTTTRLCRVTPSQLLQAVPSCVLHRSHGIPKPHSQGFKTMVLVFHFNSICNLLVCSKDVPCYIPTLPQPIFEWKHFLTLAFCTAAKSQYVLCACYSQRLLLDADKKMQHGAPSPSSLMASNASNTKRAVHWSNTSVLAYQL